MATRNYQTYMGPTDPNLRHSEIEGYQPVSRIGEVVINSFIDSYEFTALPDAISVAAVEPASTETDANGQAVDTRAFDLTKPYEHKPHFHEWATALPGMICVSRKARNSTFRNYVAAETATPVLSCCACLGADDMKNFYFAGICRSKSVRPIDDGVGPQIDEFFTLAIGGMATLLNNSGTTVFPGDMLEWTFYNQKAYASAASKGANRGNANPRRITIKIATAASERVIGRCLSFAKPGETFDLLLKSC
jgi:hypothetical protein